ncbi:DNA-processing protein DprA [Peptoniphilus indolicus]|nr:DNA-processing protein DprA [Peptoniphilus indolicus]
MEYRDYILYLNLIGVENIEIEKIQDYLSINDIHISEIFSSEAIQKNFSKAVRNRLSKFDEEKLKLLEEYCFKENINILTYIDDDYPDRLRYIENSPRVLYTKGKFSKDDFFSIGIVGSRNHSDYGKVVVNYIVDNLKPVGATIISGMAYGIDALSHNRAIFNNMRTIAVLGSGVDVIYPKANSHLYSEIINNGVVCSEYPPGTAPKPYRFPLRNRIISGLSLAIIVVEARNKSGSLITARIAAEQGKEVFSVPGNINSFYSEGTNALIRDGANILSSIDELLAILPKVEKKKTFEVDLSEDEIKVVECIEKGVNEIDDLARNLFMNVSELSSFLTILELKEVLTVNGKRIQLNM